ncbi:hypothetical protein N431DRAFT_367643 [Stipitochalara longipes BDJ]|nr:hypothetical protein N431DRAFT_367643 [Stipitochalara longipes BDJ]
MGIRSSNKGSYIKLGGTIDGPDCNPTRQQRDVWRFYEARNSDDADDIYSPEWYQRTLSFFDIFAKKNKKPEILKSWEMIENMEFGPFFLSHPIPAYALWHMLQAFYELDRAVCGTSDEEIKNIEKWKDMPPFAYLNAKKGKKIRIKWSKSLEKMKKEIECGELEGDALISRLASILVGVQKMESVFIALRENFTENLKGIVFVDEMIEKVGKVVEERRRVIMDLLRPGDENQGPTSDTETLIDGTSMDRTSSGDASPVEPQTSSREQVFPVLHQDTDLPRPADESDALSSQLLSTLTIIMRVLVSCVFIYLALLYGSSTIS